MTHFDPHNFTKTLKTVIKRLRDELRNGDDAFNIGKNQSPISARTLDVVSKIRGERPPAIIIHGVMPRSGTVYTGELLRLHPDLHAYPNDIWELPFLEVTGDLLGAQKHFFRAYKQNTGKIGNLDFLPLFGASLIAYLYSFIPTGKRMLLKIPDVQYLGYFYTVFPCESPLLLMRDGRDLVASTINSWPERNFGEVCKLWNNSAKMILTFQKHHPEHAYRYLTVNYEDVVARPADFVTAACEKYSLDQTMYPYEKIKELPVRGSSNLGKQEKKDLSWNPVEKPKDFNPVGHWKSWASFQKKTFKKIAGQTLIDAGYSDNLRW